MACTRLQLLITILLLPLSTANASASFGKLSSCSSKEEQHSYWASTVARSPSLTKLMSQYEIHHQRCRSMEKDLDSSIRNRSKLDCQYLLWRAPYVGMGNRLLSLISTYLLALLTNRVLITDRVWDWENIFCQPFPHSSMLLDTLVDGHYVQNNAMPLDKFTAMDFRKSNSSLPFSVVWHITHEPDKSSFCPIETEMLGQVPMLVVYSNMYFVPGLYTTGFESQLRKLFPDNQAFIHLARYLLNPVNDIWTEIKSVYSAHMDGYGHKVGVQIRTFDHPWRLEKSLRVLKCAQMYGLLPGSYSGLKSFGQGSVSCMVASLRPQFYNRLRDQFLNEAHRVHVFRVGKAVEQNSDSYSHNKEAVVELWLLSFCNSLLTSLASTFGYIASGLAGKAPYFVAGMNAYDKGFRPADVCNQSLTAEPCFHFPTETKSCQGGHSPDLTLKKDMERCGDFPRGIRLTVA